MQTVELDTVYRTSDPAHLLFQSRICERQPPKELLREYFHGRHWASDSLESCVAEGMRKAKERGCTFTWLTATNAGSEEVCRAALQLKGIREADLAEGFVCDPQTKSSLRILARPGIILRLSRNLDKTRGFVNGALAEVVASLRGNAIFVCRLLASGNYVLVHPMLEDGAVFLPCCYGYATTIRRAQGASLDMGCIYFDQHKHPAGRGYGYVAVSRFRNRSGCHLFGKLRMTDFLPVGEEREDEVTKRGYQSETDDSEDEGMEHAFQGGASSEDEGMSEDEGIEDGMEHAFAGMGEEREYLSGDDFDAHAYDDFS